MVVGFDGRTLAECETSPLEYTYAQLSLSEIRDSRKNDQSQNHLYKLLHRGYTGTLLSKEDDFGKADCAFQFYQDWVQDPQKVKTEIEKMTRKYPGVKSAPIDGIPFN